MSKANIERADVEKYNRDRRTPNPENLCNAPFTNIYFNSWGNAGACWLTLESAPTYPQKSLNEIWFGEFFQQLRKNIQDRNLQNGCTVCKKRIQDQVYPQVLARAYDIEHEITPYPQIMEFELSNLCNLACIMCKGSLSSKIRKDREQLEPLKSPYDDKFIEQLKEFLPHLKEARFNGGEPFLQQMCWKAWDAIAEINPKILITVATNGTLLTDKMKATMEKCRFRINVSLDSLDPKTYETIRVGSTFSTVIENLKWYREYCKRKNTILSVLVNPMRMNWKEMPEYVKWCTENGYHLWFNTIWRPRHLAIWTLKSSQIEEIQKYYREYDFSGLQKNLQTDKEILSANLRAFHSFGFSQIDGWLKDQVDREQASLDYFSTMNSMSGSKDQFRTRSVFQENPNYYGALEKKTEKVFAAEVLYHYLGQQPDDLLRVKQGEADQNAVLEWVYQVCDYY